MANNIPVFEFGKDSYILKHKLDYNTSCEGEWSGVNYGVLFTDYNLARKTQSENAEKFSEIIIDYDIEDIGSIKLTYYDEEYLLILSVGSYSHEEQILQTGTTINIDSGITFINNGFSANNKQNQQYYLPPSPDYVFQEGDFFNIYFYIENSGLTGTTEWFHLGPSGETFIVTGKTDNGIPWQVTGTTTIDGFSTGTTGYTALDYTPILKYQARVVDVGENYLNFEKKLEDYIFNNIIKLINGDGKLYYKLESLDFTDKSYYAIKYILEESKWNNYFSLSATTDQLIIKPIPNKADLYFDYDNVVIEVNIKNDGTKYKRFETNCLYTKYKLDRFLEQFGYESGVTVHYDNLSPTTSLPYKLDEYGELPKFINVEIINSGDTQFFIPYTYIYATGETGSVYICLITNISGNTITLLTPRTGMLLEDIIISINNMHTIGDISKMLYECYINIENSTPEDIPFFDANLYDPEFYDMDLKPYLRNLNVIDPEGGIPFKDPEDIPYVFDSRSMMVIGTGVSFLSIDGSPCISGDEIFDIYVMGVDTGFTSWYITGNTELFTSDIYSGYTNTTIVTSGIPLMLGNGEIEFRWENNDELAYSYPISVISICP